MRNLKKFLALVLAMMMTLSLMVTVNASSFEDYDSIGDTYKEAVNVLSALDIIKGYGEDDPNEGKFLPKNPITRAEVAAMIYRVAHNDASESYASIYKDYERFPDVKSTSWYAGVANYCGNSEIIRGYPNGTFGPGRNVTGYEVLVMVLRMLGYGQNGELEGKEWTTQSMRYGRVAGLTKNIKEGTLGQTATREMVAEIMFQALQADLVEYNLFQNYHPAKELLPNNAETREAYADALEDDRLELPLNADLMYVNYGIVGKSHNLTFDKFGRPSVTWVKDESTDVTVCSNHGTTDGDAEKYVPNAALETETGVIAFTVRMPAVKTYDNAVTECQVAKDVTGDKTLDWKNIAEVLNGNGETGFDGTTGTTLGKTHTLAVAGTEFTNKGVNHADGQTFDALHTSDKWIGATGRTTEIYDVRGYNVVNNSGDVQSYIFVYADTFLGEVTNITEAILDPNDHVIKPATATVKLGNNAGGTDALVTISVTTGVSSYKVGDLVLIQTVNGGGATAIDGIQQLPVGAKVPATPEDVPDEATQFVDCADVGRADIKRVTIKATVGLQDDKMGIISTDSETIYASNTFLAAKGTGAPTVLKNWYDVDVATNGITNSMIGRTYDLVLDQHGYIVGMKEVLTIDSTVGVITGIDTDRAGMGKYVSVVEAYMTDGSTKTFNVIDMTQTEFDKIDDAPATINTKAFKFFANSAAADNIWADGATYGDKMGVGSLVMFKQCRVDGVDVWYFADTSNLTATEFLWDAAGNKAGTFGAVGTALDKDTGAVKTGNALTLETVLDLDNATLAGTKIPEQLDNKSIVFVADPEYAYNAGNANEGKNSVKYNVFEGFKKMPTITAAQVQANGQPMPSTGGTADHVNILYQQLINNPEYVLVYPQNLAVEYIIRGQSTITVDDSYLVLSRGATYATYSEYNVLKNGEKTTLSVSNSNDTLNLAIEAAMTTGKLLTVTGRNGAGHVISVETVAALAQGGNDVAIDNCGGVMSAATTLNPLVTGANTVLFSENDGVLNFVDYGGGNNIALTVADNCTVQLVNLGTGAVKDINMSVAKTYINKESTKLQDYCDFTFELDQYGYVCSLYVIEQ